MSFLAGLWQRGMNPARTRRHGAGPTPPLHSGSAGCRLRLRRKSPHLRSAAPFLTHSWTAATRKPTLLSRPSGVSPMRYAGTKSCASSSRRDVSGLPGPVPSDHDDHHVALLDLGSNVLTKILSEGDRMHVHEDTGIAEVAAEPIIDPSGNARGFLPPVREEDLRHPGIHASDAAFRSLRPHESFKVITHERHPHLKFRLRSRIEHDRLHFDASCRPHLAGGSKRWQAQDESRRGVAAATPRRLVMERSRRSPTFAPEHYHGPGGLNGRVRDGDGYDPAGMVPEDPGG